MRASFDTLAATGDELSADSLATIAGAFPPVVVALIAIGIYVQIVILTT